MSDPEFKLHSQKIQLQSFEHLLEGAGHRPARIGNRWHCSRCPFEKSATLSIDFDREVFHCFRCGVGGNAITLKKELGLLAASRWTREERQRFAHRKSAVKRETENFLAWFRAFHKRTIDRFRSAFDRHLELRNQGWEFLAQGQEVPESIVESVMRAAIDEEESRFLLDDLDDPSNRERIYRDWKSVNARR